MPNKRVHKCSIRGCRDKTSPRHRFPLYYQNVMKQWIAIANKPCFKDMTDEEIYKNHYICRRHFSDIWFVHGTKRGLKVDAIPTLFLGNQEDSQSVEPENNCQNVEAENNYPSVEAENNCPSVQSENSCPSVQAESNCPSVQAENNYPRVQSENSCPSVQSENNCPSVLAENNCPSVQSENNCPSVQAESNCPNVQSESNCPSVQSENNYPRVQSENNCSSVHADNDCPNVEDSVCQSKVPRNHNLSVGRKKKTQPLSSWPYQTRRPKHISDKQKKATTEIYKIYLENCVSKSSQTFESEDLKGNMQYDTEISEDINSNCYNEGSLNKTNNDLPDSLSSLLSSDKTVCRFCLGTENVLHQLFSEVSQSTKDQDEYRTAILSSIPVMIEKNDGLPQCICESCYNALVSWYDFREMCISSNIILRQYISNKFIVGNSKRNPELNSFQNNFSSACTPRVALPHFEKMKTSSLKKVSDSSEIGSCDNNRMMVHAFDKENENTDESVTIKQNIILRKHLIEEDLLISVNRHPENILAGSVDSIKLSCNKKLKKVYYNRRLRKRVEWCRKRTGDCSSWSSLNENNEIFMESDLLESHQNSSLILCQPVKSIPPTISIRNELPFNAELNMK